MFGKQNYLCMYTIKMMIIEASSYKYTIEQIRTRLLIEIQKRSWHGLCRNRHKKGTGRIWIFIVVKKSITVAQQCRLDIIPNVKHTSTDAYKKKTHLNLLAKFKQVLSLVKVKC